MQGSLINESGMTLVEILVATVLIAVGLLAGSTAILNASREIKRFNLRAKVTDIAYQVSTSLSDRRNCERNFVDSQIPKISVSVSPRKVFDVQEIAQFDPTGNNTGTIASRSANSNFQFTSIQLVPRVDLPITNQILADLVLSVGTTQDSNLRTVPILLDLATSGGTVSSCITVVPPDQRLQAKACAIASDGNSVFDPVTKECVPSPDIAVYFGTTPYLTQCPAGTVLVSCGGGATNNGVAVGYLSPDPTLLNCPIAPTVTTYGGASSYTCPAFFSTTQVPGTDSCQNAFPVGFDATNVRVGAKCRSTL